MASTTPASVQSDFVQVQLTEQAATFANGSAYKFHNGRRAFSFVAGTAQKVERSYEWKALLSRCTLPDGTPVFELVPSPAPATPPAETLPDASSTDAKAAAKTQPAATSSKS